MKHAFLTLSHSILRCHTIDEPTCPRSSHSYYDLGYAQYQGAVDTLSNITQFLGIRYAAPPDIGDLRFRAPHAPVKTAELQLATAQPNECVQGLTGKAPANPLEARATEIVVASEDCLFLKYILLIIFHNLLVKRSTTPNQTAGFLAGSV
ncbi:hypothetical protein DFH08DRAFT_715662 [Mycena albidolilacea]|uniref:Carboxylesterase type B domain-containing protein n=1 Tax=Mycena albidolilacea TaxID=1033008 RepID=A0AAD6ZBZ7_9AGAR|nr:hypothetical protein DFH08DRAFT_715662 [Mycena albidolilacea]